VMEPDELKELAADIKAHGQREPILLFEGAIIDGRNRFKACEIALVKPRFKAFTGDDPAALVASLNLHRRHLNESQRAMLAAELLKSTPQICGVAAQAAKLVSVSTRSVETALKVNRLGSVDLKKAVLRGAVAVSKAASVSHLPKQKQIAALTAPFVRGTRPPPRPFEMNAVKPATNPNGSGTRAAVFAAVNEVHDSMLSPYASYDARTVKAFTLSLLTKLEKVL